MWVVSVPENDRHTMRNGALFNSLLTFHLPRFNTPFSDSVMDLPLEGSSIRSQEPRVVGFEEIEGLWRATEDLAERQKAKIAAQSDEILRLKSWKERYAKKYRGAKERIVELEREVRKISRAHQETLGKQDQRIQTMADRLTRTEELLAVRSAELAGAQPFLSMTDDLSEAEVLGTVRDLNENVFQVAANLTEEWEKLGLPRATKFTVTQNDVDVLSQFCGPALIHPVLHRNPTTVTFLVQSCLCHLAMQITSSWRHNKDLCVLGSVYQSLSTSEGQAISARWRSLTHSYLSKPSLDSNSIVQRVADILWITGSFSSPRRSFDFVKTVGLSGIETINRLALRLESVFMVEVASSDMYLLFETPHTVFDSARMTNEFGSDGTSTSGRRRRVAGTTEVGVGKNVGMGRGEGQRTEILLKTKVVLERDVAGL
ncbi:hypothetical protein BDM02DRAFT_1001325 [Thelephora ganbajun]|uniref:Uncharacterized protein n=1 Tax=Thelephora ganbajun TaxID=370292 RepID=A0ACB6ZN44_THEGA|nr:hypothetical protein BDM02DRAFT_1001325 [Thelephora ganbajun]